MKLSGFEYSETATGGDQWRIEPLTFDRFNLIVGRNATGKTRLLTSIARLAALLTGERPVRGREAQWRIEIADGQQYSYRVDSRSGLNAAVAGGNYSPATHWAAGLEYFPFGGQMNLHWPTGQAHTRLGLAEAYKEGMRQFAADFEASVLRAMTAVGHPIESITVRTAPSSSAQGFLEIKESKRHNFTRAQKLSQAQLRCLTLVVFLVMLDFRGQAATILIDDFAEGLDFEHAEKLTKLLLSAQPAALQFIISTNDRYVMNLVPLEQWSILVEAENTTRVFNYANSREKFEQFKFTGLSNFDFFSMDFAERGET